MNIISPRTVATVRDATCSLALDLDIYAGKEINQDPGGLGPRLVNLCRKFQAHNVRAIVEAAVNRSVVNSDDPLVSPAA